MFDAYTVKKVLPRLVIAVILIQLSWFIFSGMIFLTESIAYGIEALIYAPFGNAQDFTFEALFTSIGGSDIQVLFYSLIAAGAAVASFGGSIGFFALIALLALFVGVLTLLIRRILLVLLLVLSPLALVAWILPNTERFWKMWWDNFTKLLLMYPIILAMVAAGRVMAKIGGQFGEESIAVVMVLGGVFLPLALIPKTFNMAGSAFSAIGGTLAARASGLGKGFAARGRKRGAERWKGRGEELLKGNALKGGNDSNWRGRANRRLQQVGHLNKAGIKPWTMRENIATAVATTNKVQRDKMKEDVDYQDWMHNDGLNRAAAESNNAAELRENLRRMRVRGEYGGDDRQMEEDVARVERMRRKYGTDAMRQRATLQAIAGGTAYKTASGQWRAVANASRGDRSVMQDMVAEGRSAGMSAGRVDASGAGFGDTLGVVERMWRDGATYSDAQADRDITRAVLRSQGAGVVTHASMKPQAIMNLIPEIQRDLTAAIQSGDVDKMDDMFAYVESLRNGLAGSSPQLVDEFQNALLGTTLQVGTLQPQIADSLRGAIDEIGPGDVYTEHEYETVAPGAAPGPAATGAAGPPAPVTATTTGTSRTKDDRLRTPRTRITIAQALNARLAASARMHERMKLYNNPNENPAATAPPGPGAPPIPPAGGGPPAGPIGSDVRLKENISYLYTTDNDIKIYSFNYIGSPAKLVGVMAQDLLGTQFEHCVITHEDGFYRVNYDGLGLKMASYEDYKLLGREAVELLVSHLAS